MNIPKQTATGSSADPGWRSIHWRSWAGYMLLREERAPCSCQLFRSTFERHRRCQSRSQADQFACSFVGAYMQGFHKIVLTVLQPQDLIIDLMSRRSIGLSECLLTGRSVQGSAWAIAWLYGCCSEAFSGTALADDSSLPWLVGVVSL